MNILISLYMKQSKKKRLFMKYTGNFLFTRDMGRGTWGQVPRPAPGAVRSCIPILSSIASISNCVEEHQSELIDEFPKQTCNLAGRDKGPVPPSLIVIIFLISFEVVSISLYDAVNRRINKSNRII